jgi:beta-N-acetylhexosaminidase
VILFGDNTSGPGGARRLTAALRRAAGGEVLIATDGEGVPARRLKEQGVNLDLAPVADVPGAGSVVAGRAFSGSPAQVGEKAAAAVRAYAAQGIAATAKHFPGFGRATETTDDVPVTIRASRTALRRDLVPFRAAVGANVPLVMVSHALYPALDTRRVASQSRPVIEGLLRRRLGFKGAVITDSIEARGLIHRKPGPVDEGRAVAQAAERSIEAGADLLLMTGRGSWVRVYPALLARARRDPQFRARVEEAAARVRRLKLWLRRRR